MDYCRVFPLSFQERLQQIVGFCCLAEGLMQVPTATYVFDFLKIGYNTVYFYSLFWGGTRREKLWTLLLLSKKVFYGTIKDLPGERGEENLFLIGT